MTDENVQDNHRWQLRPAGHGEGTSPRLTVVAATFLVSGDGMSQNMLFPGIVDVNEPPYRSDRKLFHL